MILCSNDYEINCRTGKRRSHCQQKRTNLKRFQASTNKCKKYGRHKTMEVICCPGLLEPDVNCHE